ncbi:FAD-binding oxidoreductase [Nocardioides caldifontis]|uniref:FAD-binding oxidoreductase n=1 Tax=Nocardioides caldifontis TaxID=2588938 RepID=UPI0013968370|nr:FAD-binding oxidoreductase [Nocardioides caldifontis]
MNTTTTSPSDVGLPEGFTGAAIRPGDPDYDEARSVYNAMIDRRPQLVVRPRGAADIRDAVAFARQQRLPLAVKCGGHSVAGTSAVEGGLLIDLSSLKGVHVDPERGTAIANAGALWGEYDRETEIFGLATPGGRVTTTGVGGFCLGGGYGWLSTKHGLTCDNLVAADIVTASGHLLHVTEDTNPELMWGLRGAGANFGVVTSYELKLHALPPLLMAGMLIVPNDDEAADVVRAYRDHVESGPDDLVTALATVLAPPADFVPPEVVGQPMVGIVVVWLGDPAEAEAAVAPLRRIAERGMDLVQPMPYTAVQALLEGFNPKGFLNYHRGRHLRALPDAVIDDYVAIGREIGSPLTQGVVFRHGGAIAAVPEDATAAGNRSAAYMAHPIACWADPADTDRERRWVDRFTEAFAPAATGGYYLNFEPGTTETDVRAGFGDAKYERLAGLKEEYDPENVFSSNHNVMPG